MGLTRSATSCRSMLVVMAKAPVPGNVKTRLGPQIDPIEAAHLYGLFIEDVTAEMAKLAAGAGGASVAVALAYAPQGAQAALAARCPAGMALMAQSAGDLGQRMAAVFERCFAQGFEQVHVIGSDSPDLPCAFVGQAIARLGDPRIDVVLGPCPDGGYYLIGLKRPLPELFAAIPWSTRRVLETTLQKTGGLGLGVDLLNPWEDIDTYADLQRFVQRHRDRSAGAGGPGWRTLKYLQDRQNRLHPG